MYMMMFTSSPHLNMFSYLLDNKGVQINFSVIIVEQQEEIVTVQALTSQMTPLKTIRMTLVSIIFGQFGRCFEFFNIAG